MCDELRNPSDDGGWVVLWVSPVGCVAACLPRRARGSLGFGDWVVAVVGLPFNQSRINQSADYEGLGMWAVYHFFELKIVNHLEMYVLEMYSLVEHWRLE